MLVADMKSGWEPLLVNDSHFLTALGRLLKTLLQRFMEGEVGVLSSFQ